MRLAAMSVVPLPGSHASHATARNSVETPTFNRSGKHVRTSGLIYREQAKVYTDPVPIGSDAAQDGAPPKQMIGSACIL